MKKKFYRISKNIQSGQALITLLFFTLIAVIVISAVVVIMSNNILAASKQEEGLIAYQVAESGAENAILRFLRNPSYTGETGLSIGTGTVDITVTGTGPYTITSKGTVGGFQRTIQVTLSYVNNILTVTSWNEI